ncbi:Glycosyl hydrolase family 115 [Cnuella takakiae]|uniref:Glycosyl hydrolase family 115 n=1 Tax=Cnuella takakiae TaxID=1302690 RepID=A0A1M5BRR3_9BACT|nr:glycosyl hydrolase 115 family protein [Cnuella takakiae]OLY93492.1 glycosyhydrolase [Cnuella takakiae]SHF45223.1 Glycosyl hydrolase family 115 [Cnuella takakiae]
MKAKLLCLLLLSGKLATAQEWVSNTATKGGFALTGTTILVDSTDAPLVLKSASLLQQDILAVTGYNPPITASLNRAGKNTIVLGTLNAKPLLQLQQNGKLKTQGIKGQWEAYQVQTVANPFSGVEKALVIAGSDRRGAAYGVFECSKQMGVSPWYWWADVPVKKQAQLFVRPGTYTDAPKVRYRGIFINDEAPALANWSREKFGGFNHQFYEKVFELILRLKGNYLWPAMWGSAFYDDDKSNINSADTFGIVIGTSHHEPLMRAHDEWRRYGTGKWNYDSNAVRLQDFWRKGMQRATNEKIVSIGMRGDGDEPMSRETATALLERIVKDQRSIISEVSGKPASETPQLWALYKEVQDYYDKGMRVPDDVTLLLCDDNWGNIRRLPKLGEAPRKGGYGIYYHFDYVGGPRNYKWLNTNNLARVWEQMHLAWAYNARQIWIVNVGDIKPMELPTSFFLDYAWNPERIGAKDLPAYYSQWAAGQFGTEQAQDIGQVLQQYAQLSARRKPELLHATTYNLINQEWDRVVNEWSLLRSKAERIGKTLAPQYGDAYFQLVLHPIAAFANLHEMYHAVALNQWQAGQQMTFANKHAERAKELYARDSLITLQYHQLKGGKWNHLMSQTHIGYTYWQQPLVNKMPELRYVNATVAGDGPVLIEPRVLSAMDLIPAGTKGHVFYEQDGVVSMEASHFTTNENKGAQQWQLIPGIGRTGDGLSLFPVTAPKQAVGKGPVLSYEWYAYDSGAVKLHTFVSPTLNFQHSEGLQLAVSIDDEAPQLITINREDENVRTWESWVAANIITKQTAHKIAKPGKHILKVWAVDPGVVLQKLVLDFGGMQPSYLGPEETKK